jgi:hypothetical protein
VSAATPFTGLGRRRYDRVSDQYSVWDVPVPKFKGPTRTQQLRDLIREHGQLNAAQLAVMAGLESSALVGGLLKHDLHLGRVKFDGVGYLWNDDYNERLGEAIADAIALLRRHGYVVQKNNEERTNVDIT